MKQQLPRSRPTNNQLLYKAHFRWEHYSNRQVQTDGFPTDTEPCASVTAAFLKVLSILQRVEAANTPARNILQILATNTRRTKVLELSSGTHRIPDELKKHYLTDDYGAQYSTNLDRNRYGSDNNYLFTVIKHDLETLGICPCLVDVEIIDAKAQGDSQLVTAGPEACTCLSRGPPKPAQQTTQQQGECSQLFEALVAAAADATEQADTDTAAQDVAASDVAKAHKANSEHHLNGVMGINHAPAADILTPSPRKRRAPKRVPTGLFSVNSSDLMGCGFSNLGNSGLVIGDLDLDRKGEVEQRPLPKRSRRLNDADTISEEGDTDRYLKSVNTEAPENSDPWRHNHVLRQNSVVGAGECGSKDARSLMAEVQHLQQNQAALRSALEAHKRSSVESELVIGQLQRGIKAMHDDRARMQLDLEATEKRVSKLETALAESVNQFSTLRSIVSGLITNDKDGEAALMQLGSAQPLTLPNNAQTKLFSEDDAAAHEDAHQRKENNHLKPDGINNLPVAVEFSHAHMQQCVHEPVGNTVPNISHEPSARSLQNTPAKPMEAPGENLRRVHNIVAANQSAQGHGTGLPSQEGLGLADTQAIQDFSIKIEDCEAIKKLPQFDNFGSLSDLGSLFSGGAGRSVDVRSGSRQAPQANVSITSPHLTYLQNSKTPGQEVKEDTLQPVS